MKKRKPNITDNKLRGEWAEMCFMVSATEHGLHVSKPWGDSRTYDFVVGRPRHFVCVQVKSTISELEDHGYIVTMRGDNQCYPLGSFDFPAAYVIFENAWYIIPDDKIQGKRGLTFYPRSKRAKYEKYREAWHLLNPDIDSKRGYIDSIQGCAEEFAAEWSE